MMFELLETLSGLPGVSGCEEAVRYEILRRIEGQCIYRVDPLGNILAFKKGRETPPQTRMFSAHMDEVGLVVTYIEDCGLLRFAAVGGIEPQVLTGKMVDIGDTPGVIGTKAMHQKSADERGTAVPVTDMYIDIGAKDRSEAEQVVSPGDRAVFRSHYRPFGNGFIQGKALDDRAGCALLIQMIRSELRYDTHFAFTVQEETGTTGGRTAAQQIQPGIAFVVETTTACDIPDTPENRVVCRLGRGPVLSFMDKGAVYDIKLYQRALELAKEQNIRCQSKLGVYGGNEARSVQIAGAGARTLAVSLPCRYLHTPSCVLHRDDMTEALRMLTALAGEPF